MSLSILDTDMLSLYQRRLPVLVAWVGAHDPGELAITVITVESRAISTCPRKHAPRSLEF